VGSVEIVVVMRVGMVLLKIEMGLKKVIDGGGGEEKEEEEEKGKIRGPREVFSRSRSSSSRWVNKVLRGRK
jgi:hypothetical protein